MELDMNEWMIKKGYKSKTKQWIKRTNQTIVNYITGALIFAACMAVYHYW